MDAAAVGRICRIIASVKAGKTFVCITAGICEETIFRGMPMYLLHNQISGINTAGIVVVTSMVFGVAHAYQGWRGILAAAAFGAVLMFGYAQIGTLLWNC